MKGPLIEVPFKKYTSEDGRQGGHPWSVTLFFLILRHHLLWTVVLNDHSWMYHCRLLGAWQVLPIHGVLFQIKNTSPC